MVKASSPKKREWGAFAVLAFTALCAILPSFRPDAPARAGASPIVEGASAGEPVTVGLRLDETGINTTAQDDTQQIWGIKAWTLDGLHRWNGTKWRLSPFAESKGFSPFILRGVEDGAVLCLWRSGAGGKPKNYLLSEHRANTSRVVARWKGNHSGAVRLFRSRRATWVTWGGTDIYRVQNETARRVYQIVPGQMHSDSSAPLSNWGDNALDVLEDGRGHTWFWSNEFSGGFNRLSLRGLLEFDGQKWTHHARLPGVADKPFTAVVRRNARSFWLAVGNEGLFELEIQTLQGKPINSPLPGAFDRIQSIQQVGGIWYLVANAPEMRFPGGDLSRRESDLWRWNEAESGTSANSGTGGFERILRGLDHSGDYSVRVDRPLLATRSGLWVGALSGGAWWVPFGPNRPPVHVDWRRDLWLRDVRSLFLQGDGRLFVSSWQGCASDLRAALTVRPSQEPATFTIYGSILEDARHHLWRVPNLSSHTVEEWDGKRWLSHPLPATYSLKQFFYLSSDARGRVWLLPDDKDGVVALFRPGARSWRMYPSFPLALQDQLGLLGPKEFARLNIGQRKYLAPCFASPNRIAFRSTSEKLFYFDGHTWRQWTVEQITSKKQLDGDDWEGSPYFDATGTLCANIDGQTRMWTPASGWKAGAGEAKLHPFPETPTPTPPPGSAIAEPESITRDSSGAIWMTKNRQLWKAAWGVSAPQLAPGERHTVRDGRRLGGVLLGPGGRPLIATGWPWEYEYAWMPSRSIQTQLSVTRQGEESFLLRFAVLPVSQEKHWFRWRLDKGGWSQPQTESSLPLELLPAGKHLFEVASIDARLQLDPTPATATLDVAMTPGKQLAKFMAMLRSSDYAKREVAVRALAKQPARSLPVLRAARRGASSEWLWWIDAALQEIENQSASK